MRLDYLIKNLNDLRKTEGNLEVDGFLNLSSAPDQLQGRMICLEFPRNTRDKINKLNKFEERNKVAMDYANDYSKGDEKQTLAAFFGFSAGVKWLTDLISGE